MMKKTLSLLLLSMAIFTGCSTPATPTTKFSSDFFQVEKPTQDSVITSPVEISGQALGTMFFEGTFPVTIEDSNGQTLGSGTATSTADWMTEKLIPFAVKITFKTPTTKTGFIVLKNDNPSDLPENEHSAKFSISFK